MKLSVSETSKLDPSSSSQHSGLFQANNVTADVAVDNFRGSSSRLWHIDSILWTEDINKYWFNFMNWRNKFYLMPHIISIRRSGQRKHNLTLSFFLSLCWRTHSCVRQHSARRCNVEVRCAYASCIYVHICSVTKLNYSTVV
jgi:hypothetical protein